MSNRNISQPDLRMNKKFSCKILHLNERKEFSMKNGSFYIHDTISPQARLSTPFSYLWLKFKNHFRKLTLQKGVIL